MTFPVRCRRALPCAILKVGRFGTGASDGEARLRTGPFEAENGTSSAHRPPVAGAGGRLLWPEAGRRLPAVRAVSGECPVLLGCVHRWKLRLRAGGERV